MFKLKLTGLFLGYLTLLLYTLSVSFAEGQIVFGGGGGSGGVTGWPNVLTGAATTSESSDSTKIRIRGTAGQSTSGANFYQDSSGVFKWVCVVSNVENACNYIRKLAATYYWGIEDASGNSVFKIFPSAASLKATYPFGTSYYPLKSLWFGASSLSVDGTNCATPTEATPLASSVKLFTVICLDNDSSRMQGSILMPAAWDGGTVTMTALVTQTAAETNVVEYQTAMQCKGDTETLVTLANYGTEVVWTDTMSGSSKVNMATSGAVTPAGTCAAGDFLAFYVDIGATNTTATMTSVHIIGFILKYSVTSLSD